jgi:peptidoglycan L-alanyl-D-glutamate endopeptidase CwlK
MDKKQKYWLIGLGAGVVLLGVLIVSYRNEIKGFAKKTLGGYKWFDDTLTWYRNEGNQKIVEGLHPKARSKFKEFISRVEKELKMKFILTSGHRTFEKQAELYRKNSNNAKAGNSSHNYGFALDLNVIDKNGRQLMKKDSTADWKASGIVDIAKEMGFKWGGDFSGYHDPIHFYLEPLARDDMKKRYLAGKKDSNGYIDINSDEEKTLLV